ncbi:MAG: IPT/TIG domain-containing protein [Bryobacterales bacterium]
MLNSNLRLLCVFLLATLTAWAAVPRVTSVEPGFGKNGEELLVNGQNLDSANVTNLFLTAAGEDHEVEIKEQTTETIRFVIPAELALGRYNLTVQTGGLTPAILVQPISCSVVDEEGAKKMAAGQEEVEIVEQQPEPQPETKKQ